jgi:hypothetical protein
MAAGLGFKTFATGDVLSAADTNGYLMQGVLVFASAAARDSSITSPQEGQFAYLKDTNVTTYYTGSAWANLDTTGMTNPMTTTGDTIYSSSGSTPARLGIGSTGQVLTVAGGVPSWATPASGSTFSGVYCRNSVSQSIANNTYTAVNLNTEIYDVGGYHDNSTNNTRFTIPSGKAGYYQIAFGAYYALNGTGARNIVLYKNGSSIISGTIPGNSSVYSTLNLSYFDYLNVGDYLEFYTVQSSGGSLNIDVTTGGGTGYAQMFLIGA